MAIGTLARLELFFVASLIDPGNLDKMYAVSFVGAGAHKLFVLVT